MACGTGKTLTALWIKEKLNSKKVLVLLPSLSLLSQTLKEWNISATDPFNWICVCSDTSVSKNEQSNDEWIGSISDLGVPVTNEISHIKRFMYERGSNIIFSTYQSSYLIAKAQSNKLTLITNKYIEHHQNRKRQ